MNKKYDVAVIGAGPAGLWAAKTAVDHGLSVLVVEKKREIGFPTICGEFTPSEGEAKRLLPNSKLVSKFYQFLPEKCVRNRTRTVRVYSPGGRRIEFKFEGLVLDRVILERSYAEKVEELGGEILTHVTAIMGVCDELIELKLKGVGVKEASARYLVGADGFPSRVAAWFNLRTGYAKSRDEAICVNSSLKLPDLEKDVVEMYSGKLVAPGGYAWIIPKDEESANVGLGVRRAWMENHGKVNIKEFFNHFLIKHTIASTKLIREQTFPLYGKILPVGGIVKELVRDRVMLAGDAAGLVIPINGSGLLTAAISGMLAGEVAWRDALGEGDVRDYRGMVISEMGDALEKGLLYRRFIDLLTLYDRMLDFSFLLGGSLGVSNVLLCQGFWPAPLLKALLAR